MNAKQRRKARRKGPDPIRCPECGEWGPHWMTVEPDGLILPYDPLNLATQGFWVCDKFYGPDGRRINP